MKFFARARFFLLVAIVGFAIAACSRSANNPAVPSGASGGADCRTLPHLMGATEICGRPQKIVVIGSPLLELLLTLDVQPAGYSDPFATHLGDYDDPPRQIPYLGKRVKGRPVNIGSSFNPSIEAMLKARPDLILATEYNRADYQTLSELAPTLILQWFDADENLQTIAEAIGYPEKAEKFIAERQQRIDTARERFAIAVEEYPKILALAVRKFPEFSLITDANGFCASLLEDLGFQLVYPPGIDGKDPTVVPTISLELLPQLDEADTIAIFAHNDTPLDRIDRLEEHHLTDVKQAWEKNAIAQSMNASRAERAYFIPMYLCLGLPGPIGTELYLNKLEKQILPQIPTSKPTFDPTSNATSNETSNARFNTTDSRFSPETQSLD